MKVIGTISGETVVQVHDLLLIGWVPVNAHGAPIFTGLRALFRRRPAPPKIYATSEEVKSHSLQRTAQPIFMVKGEDA